MPRPTPYLTNCYIPQPLPSTERDTAAASFLPVSRTDDRATHSLRQLRIQSSKSSPNNDDTSSSSCLVELGHTKVQCRVLAPLYAGAAQLPTSVALDMDQGTLHVQVKYASHISYPAALYMRSTAAPLDSNNNNNNNNNRFTSWIMTRETVLAKALHTALAAAVPLEPYPKACILVQISVLQDDGSILPACVTACTTALCQARVTLLDTVTACTVAVVNVQQQEPSAEQQQQQQQNTTTQYWADPTLEEEECLHCKALVTIGVMPSSSREVTLWEQSGRPLTPQETNQAMDLARDGCRTFARFIRQHLVTEFEIASNDC